jgi:putative restriction endonuclease
MHRPTQAGISGNKAEGADSVVVSGGYVDDIDFGSYLIYTGHGGRKPGASQQTKDQSIEATGNAGLITSRVKGLPVRVIRGAHFSNPYAPPK